jgi:hypothetical protein
MKKKRLTPDERAKIIERIIKLVYDSLDSHLPYTHESDNGVKASKKFHKVCTEEYAEIIKLVSMLY